jgi:hypothetical protein
MVLGVCVVGLAKDDFPIKVYPCPEVKNTPAIDGTLEALWQSAPLVSGFTYYDLHKLAPVQTSVRLLYDRKNLYVGVVADEPLADRVGPTKMPRDGSVFREESIEVFIDPDHDHTRYYQFGANPVGSLYDAEGYNAAWDSGAAVAGRLQEESWTLELAVPWKSLGVEEVRPGRVVGFNVCRNRYVGGQRQWMNWSQTEGGFHDPARFAHLVLSPTPEQLGRLEAEFRKGDRMGPLRIYGPEGYSEASYRALATEKLKKVQKSLRELEAVASEEVAGAAAQELGKRLAPFRDRIAGHRETIESGKKIDAKLWVEMELDLDRIGRQLSEVIWEARLAALLAEI